MIRRNRAELVTTKDKPWQPARFVAADAAGVAARGIVDIICEPPLAPDTPVVADSGPPGTSVSITHRGAKAA